MNVLRPSSRLVPALVFMLAAGIYASAGFHNTLGIDAAVDIYAGQQVLAGIPPDVSIFVVKTPLGPLAAALGVALGRFLGIDDILAARLLCYLMGCLTVVCVYLLGKQVAGGRGALLAALTFLGFYPFTLGATSGPDPKVPMLLFATAGMYLASTRRWLWAGLCGSLAGLAWQPGFAFPALIFALALFQPRPARAGAALATLAGGVIPLAAVLAYFAERRALPDLLDATIMYPLFKLDRHEALLTTLRRIIGVVASSYRSMAVPIAIGFAVMLGWCVWRAAHHRSLRSLGEDRFAPVLLTFVPPILWSLRDFQGAPDFFIFLPYVALGFGLFADKALPDIAGQARLRLRRYALSAGAGALLLGAAVASNVEQRGSGLDAQAQAARTILARFGPDVRIISSYATQVLALTRRQGATPTFYPGLREEYDAHLEARYPGGFGGWLRQIKAYDPQLIVLGSARGRHGAELMDWMRARYRREKIGPWTVWIKHDLRTAQ